MSRVPPAPGPRRGTEASARCRRAQYARRPSREVREEDQSALRDRQRDQAWPDQADASEQVKEVHRLGSPGGSATAGWEDRRRSPASTAWGVRSPREAADQLSDRPQSLEQGASSSSTAAFDRPSAKGAAAKNPAGVDHGHPTTPSMPSRDPRWPSRPASSSFDRRNGSLPSRSRYGGGVAGVRGRTHAGEQKPRCRFVNVSHARRGPAMTMRVSDGRFVAGLAAPVPTSRECLGNELALADVR